MHLRLNWTFLVVLGVSVLGTAIAAWAITFASSHSRVVVMASDFTSLAEATVHDFSGLVADLLQNSSMIVGTILNQETQAGVARSAATEAQVAQSSQQLLDFARNSTAQSQVQMTVTVADVGTFITGMIGNFENISASYAQELRYEFAMKTQTDFQNLITARVDAIQRLPTLVTWGLFDGDKPLGAPIDDSDYLVLAALCQYAHELGPGEELAWGTGTGRFYDCVPNSYARLLETSISADGHIYNQSFVAWYFSANTTDWFTIITSTPPVWTREGTNCHFPVVCVNEYPTCGFAIQCRPNTFPYYNLTTPKLLWSQVFVSYTTNTPFIGLTWSMVNTSFTPPRMMAVFTYAFYFTNINAYLQTVATTAGTHLAVILNDTDLTALGSAGVSCSPHEVQPGNPMLPTWSVLRNCDPRIVAMGTWLNEARGSNLKNHTTVTLNDTIWDIFVSTNSGLSYYVAVGMELSAMYAAIWASETIATEALNNLSATQTGNLDALGAQTQAYMQVLGTQNLQTIQGMQTSLISVLSQLANSSQALLNSSQAQSTAQISTMLAQQMAKVDAVQTIQLNALAVTTWWTIGLVLALFLVVLLVGALGTMRLTASLTEIITLMESVAEMKVEQLEVPLDAPVVEVARIQRAFHALVQRLAEYKTYMPAALFSPMAPTTSFDGHGAKAYSSVNESDIGGSESTDSQLVMPTQNTGSIIDLRPRGVSRGTPSSSMARRNVTAMVVNVLRFRDHALDPNIISLFSNYLKLVHRAVAQARGNLDCVVGDQIFATFNAHISCSDPVTSAVTAALDAQASFSKTAGCSFACLIGLSSGPMVSGSAGYARFRTMVALGSSMKFAFLLSRLTQFDSGAVVCDHSIAERIGFTHTLIPVDLVNLPREKPHPRGYVVYVVTGKKELASDEWLYQVGQSGGAWEAAFKTLRTAKTMAEARAALRVYRDANPGDAWARRLSSRLHAWTPGLGVPLHETADAAVTATSLDEAPVWDVAETMSADTSRTELGYSDGGKKKNRAH